MTANSNQEVAEQIRIGFSKSPKQLSPALLYDSLGSQLFDRITQLPEYYLTRTETEILESHADSLLQGIDELVELGAGYSRKTRILLDALERDGGSRYVALDVSHSAIESSRSRLVADHPSLEIEGLVANFEESLDLVEHRGRRMVVFLGSTLGNFDRVARIGFLQRVQSMLTPGDSLLLGVDLVKDIETLEAAYNDSAGLSAAFALNLLQVLNRKFDGNLPSDAFRYLASFDEENSWIDMRLQAKRRVTARLNALELDVHFEAGEELRTEVSTKFTRASLEADLNAAGLSLARWETDDEHWFALAQARI